MSKETISLETFMEAAGPPNRDFIDRVHGFMLENGCDFRIKEAKRGYALSYVCKPEKRTVANYVFRKRGPMLRIYADHVSDYADILKKWPDTMKAVVRKCIACKRMLDPEDCSKTCKMGYAFLMDGEKQQKCRFNCFLLPLEEETKPWLEEMLQCEMAARAKEG